MYLLNNSSPNSSNNAQIYEIMPRNFFSKIIGAEKFGSMLCKKNFFGL